MCNTTKTIFYNCNNTINIKTILIFIISISIILISCIMVIIFFLSKPVWTNIELERIYNSEDSEDSENSELLEL